jgi:hypothetical protein
VLTEVVGDVVQTKFLIVRNRFLALGARVAREVAGANSPTEAQAIIDRDVRDILTELSGGAVEEQSRKR